VAGGILCLGVGIPLFLAIFIKNLLLFDGSCSGVLNDDFILRYFGREAS
jgi:hypothetical protein